MAIDINGDGLIAVGGTSTTQGRVRLAEDTDNGTNYVELTANAAITTNRTVTFPDENINFTTGLGAAQGGTGATTLTAENVVIGNGTSSVKFVAPGTTGNVLTSNGSAWLSQAISAGGDYIMQVYASPATWTKPAGLKAVKVTVIGGGGCAAPSPSAAGTSSFGPFCSATGGANNAGAAGAGSGGTINVSGSRGGGGVVGPGCNLPNYGVAEGGAGAFGFGAPTGLCVVSAGVPGRSGNLYGGGGAQNASGGSGGGGAIEYLDAPAIPGPVSVTVGTGATQPAPFSGPTGSGAAGVVIVEEFY